MKIKLNSVIGLLFILHQLNAQDLVVFQDMRNSSVVQQNDLIMVSTIGAPVGGTVIQNDLVLTSEIVPFFLLGEPTSLLDLPVIEGIQVYPNPSIGVLILEREDMLEHLQVELHSAGGALIKSIDWGESTKVKLSLYAFPPGFYQLIVSDKLFTKATKFSIVRQ